LIIINELVDLWHIISESDLWKYAELARFWGVGFIRILEPRKVGFYSGKDVLLTPDHEKVLEKFFLEINSEKIAQEVSSSDVSVLSSEKVRMPVPFARIQKGMPCRMTSAIPLA
jgi:hypothetical protein